MVQLELKWRLPIAAFGPLARRSGAILLHGGERAADARWSYIVSEPSSLIESRGGETFRDGVRIEQSPFEALEELHAARRLSRSPFAPPLLSGLLGYAGYECGRFVEPTAAGPVSPYSLPDFWFGAYDAVAAFDRVEQRLVIAGRASASAERLASMLGEGESASASRIEVTNGPANFTREEYREAVASVIRRIEDGEIFQANISQRLTACFAGESDAYSLFRHASQESSAPFGAYLNVDGAAIVSMSPERFFSVTPTEDGRFAIMAEPIKGTRPRGKNYEDDAQLLRDLLGDPKDRAENVMIADLTRSDLSRVCEDHSVHESAICEAMTHATVHHLVSRIGGVLRPDVSAAGALSVIFPCGSVTGAPKVQAMKVIADAEPSGRGPYCGAIGYLDDRGGADFSVAIRLAVIEGAKISIPVGGGVTLRSDPEAEYAETMTKARWFEGCATGAGWGT